MRIFWESPSDRHWLSAPTVSLTKRVADSMLVNSLNFSVRSGKLVSTLEIDSVRLCGPAWEILTYQIN